MDLFFRAVLHNDVTQVAVALRDAAVDVNEADDQGNTALAYAVRYNCLPVLKVLLADKRTRRTPPPFLSLHSKGVYAAAVLWVERQHTNAEAAPEEYLLAVQYNDAKTVASCLRNPSVNPNMTNAHGCTALTVAVTCCHMPIVKLLLSDRRVDPNADATLAPFAQPATVAGQERVTTRRSSEIYLSKTLAHDARVDPNLQIQMDTS